MSNNDDQLSTLLEALLAYETPPDYVFEYRVYYDPQTKECTRKTIEQDEGSFIVVSKEQYDEIHFSPNYYVEDGKVVKKKLDFMYEKLLKSSTTGYKTIKGHNMFLVDNGSTNAVDYWSKTRE
jgi:hypothetical protein